MSKAKFRVVIPAAGKSSRSGLSYPKTLYRLAGIPILVRICRLLAAYDDRPIIIINPSFREMFEAVIAEFNISATLIFQHTALGMGDALLQAAEFLDDEDQILLTWSDIPLMAPGTIRKLADCHLAHANNFSLATWLGEDCYTIVERNEGKLLRVLETRALGIEPAAKGERDIGLFIFRKEPAFSLLSAGKGKSGQAEHGFLYVVELLAAAGQKIEAYPIAADDDVLSFNTPGELRVIEGKLSSPRPPEGGDMF